MPEDNTPTVNISGAGCAAVICVLALCLTAIIIAGYGPAVWEGIVAVLWWMFKAWLWLVGGVAALVIIVILVALFTSRSS